MTPSEAPAPATPDRAADRARVLAEFAGRHASRWGHAIPGVSTRFESSGHKIALTFDACGGPGGNGYDAELIALLRRERVPATLFVTKRWLATHPEVAGELAKDPLFSLENHGAAHRPCSVSGRSAFGIPGTRSAEEAIDEILGGAKAIEDLTGRPTRFFRSGTAHFDDVCVNLARSLGLVPISFSVTGDAGTGFTRKQVARAIEKAPSGSVVLLHMNHPGRSTALGVADALVTLRENGVELVRLDQVSFE